MANDNSVPSHPKAKILNGLWKLNLNLNYHYLLGSFLEKSFGLEVESEDLLLTLTEAVLYVVRKKKL